MIDTQRQVPPLKWPAIIAGVALAVAAALLTSAMLPPIPAAVASVFGLLVSGLLAGKLAPAARVYHGAVVGAAYVLAEAVGLVPGPVTVADHFTDTALVIVIDALRIAVAALGGWCSRLWSSSGKDKAR